VPYLLQPLKWEEEYRKEKKGKRDLVAESIKSGFDPA
jgi:hypothetical protein